MSAAQTPEDWEVFHVLNHPDGPRVGVMIPAYGDGSGRARGPLYVVIPPGIARRLGADLSEAVANLS